MNPKNNHIRDFLGVTAWHSLGYTGKRGVSASGEDFVSDGATYHAKATAAVFHEIAPDRKLIYKNWGGLENGSITNEIVPAVKKDGLDTMFLSIVSSSNGRVVDGLLASVVDRFTWFIAAGNDGDYDYNDLMAPENIFGVGAFELCWSETVNGEPTQNAKLSTVPAYYTSESEYVDFAAPTNVYVNGSTFGGTSCSTPVLCGMAALVNDFFIDKTGKPLPNAAMYQFLKDNSHDFHDAGKDTKTGWGYVTLPPPNTIDIERYAMEDKELESKVAAASEWAKESWRKAILAGVTDGTNPQGAITREQVIVMLDRLGLIQAR